MGTPRIRDRVGMTLIELMIALTVFGVVISAAVGFMAKQNDAFQVSIQRLVALRNLRYATSTLSQDLETLGTNVPDGQPAFYYGDDDVVVFSADYATNIAGDPFAVYHDPDAPSGQVQAPSGAFTIPNSSVAFPDTAYESAPGIRSPAEVLIFYFAADSTTARSDDFQLFRRINAGDAEAIARNLLRDGSAPFFSYERLGDDGTGAQVISAVPDSLVPIRHDAVVHGSPADTAASALADSVRAVTVRFRATNGLSGPEEVVVSLSRLIPLPNAGFGMLSTCGSAPLLGVGLTAVYAPLGTGEPAVSLTWSPAIDETGGEGDVVRYVVWRRDFGATDWGEPYLAIPAGAATYSYQDASVTSGEIYEYGLAAQDCTPSLSSRTASGAVAIP
jgi:prepilin-type N-terminal cleavage/methylation domain-containing protein